MKKTRKNRENRADGKNRKNRKNPKNRKAFQKKYRDAGMPLGSYDVLYAVFHVSLHPFALPHLLRALSTIIVDFFYIQFAVKNRWRKIPVVSVDHPLDNLIPFKPQEVSVYFDFITFWGRALAMTLKVFGTTRGLPIVMRFLDNFTLLYKSALRIYHTVMTTTFRPPFDEKKYPLLVTVRKSDPHLLCVPSLHISVMALMCSFYRDVFRHAASRTSNRALKSQYDELMTEIYNGAIEISESVLYVKQHSVNCIPAALFMMCSVLGDIFTKDNALDFIDALFTDRTDIAAADKLKIRDHLHYVFERMILETCYEDDWAVTVRRYIKTYKA
ncbi:MAG: hypothetical protein Ta2A_25500 [Treponemataceae bacterium]|nr:MAG: hypothetical protein Ta2A_25500 [Treponemataceae bacterium]